MSIVGHIMIIAGLKPVIFYSRKAIIFSSCYPTSISSSSLITSNLIRNSGNVLLKHEPFTVLW